MVDQSGAVTVDVAIIGAGLGGLIAAAKLVQNEIESFAILERGDGVGGVWYANRYPNIACDTAIELYGISFYPGQKWTRNFASGKEIREYIEDFARDHDIKRRVTNQTEITRAVWDELESIWSIKSSDGRIWRCRYLIWAGGLLSRPLIPTIPGLDRFKGQSFHTAEWPADADLTGKSVAVVGAGATAIQVVPYVAQHAKQTAIFVRTPSYVMERPDVSFSEADRLSPSFQSEQLARREGWLELFEKMAEARFPMIDEAVAQQEARWRVFFESQVQAGPLREIMTPKYRFGCKRPLFSNEYYPALASPNVTVIGKGVASVGEHTIVDTDGVSYPADILVWATGFDGGGMLGGLDIVGIGGQSLSNLWQEIPQAYFGVMVKNFPNLFLINGPNVGGPSATEFAEGQSDLIVYAIKTAALEGADSVTVSSDVHDAFNDGIQALFNASVLVKGNCSSWYRVGGDGPVFTHWPGTLASFHQRLSAEARGGLRYQKNGVTGP